MAYSNRSSNLLSYLNLVLITNIPHKTARRKFQRKQSDFILQSPSTDNLDLKHSPTRTCYYFWYLPTFQILSLTLCILSDCSSVIFLALRSSFFPHYLLSDIAIHVQLSISISVPLRSLQWQYSHLLFSKFGSPTIISSCLFFLLHKYSSLQCYLIYLSP